MSRDSVDQAYDTLVRAFLAYMGSECCAHHSMTVITYSMMAACRIVGLDIRQYANMLLEDARLIELKEPIRKEEIQ